jgi:hypothetical protein
MHTSFSGGASGVNPGARCNPACTGHEFSTVARRTTLHSPRYTLGLMDAKPSGSPEPASAGAEDAVERYGPLEVRRLRKDDGRQLIAYGVDEGAEAREDPAGER